jgi:hypothetical protein
MQRRERTLLVEFGGRVLAGALGWLLVFAGCLCLLGSLAVVLVDYPGETPLLNALSVGASLLVVLLGVYGNPRLRERIHESL